MSDHTIVPADQILPARLFIVPMRGKPIFPGILTPLMLPSAQEADTVEKALAADSFIGLVLSRTDELENPPAEELFEVGTVAKIARRINLPDGGVNIFISTMKRFKIKRVLQGTPPISVVAQYLEDENFDTTEVKALTRALISEMKQVSENNPLFSEEMRLSMVNIDQPGKIADFITSILNIDRAEQQRILETTDVQARMEHVLIFIKKEQELMKIQKKIQEQLNEKITKGQREYFLKEQLKAIKTELGMAVDAKTSEYQRFKEAVEKLAFQGEVKDQVEQELEKFSLMEPSSPEFTVTRNYLETIVALPWNAESKETIDIDKALAILNEDHYGLEDVKQRIVEYLAVRKLKQDSKGSIVCLVGPPGGRQDVSRKIHCPRPEPPVLPIFRGRHARRGGNQGTPSDLHRGHAGQDHPGAEDREDEEPGLHDRRDRQAGRLLPGGSLLGAPGSPGSRSRTSPSGTTTWTCRSTSRTSSS